MLATRILPVLLHVSDERWDMRIRPGASLIPELNLELPQLPVDRKIILYIRQSSMGQVKRNVQSKIQQDTMMERMLLQRGWTSDLIVKIALD